MQKNLEAILLFEDFSLAFDSLDRGKIEQILVAYSLPKESVAAIMILNKNTKGNIRSSNGDTHFIDIVVDAQQRDTLVSYLLIICLR